MKNQKPDIKTVRLLQNIALISGIFAFVLSILIIVNFIQVRRADPLNTPTLKILQERLKTNPEDDQLRTEIRELDLLARKAYFTNQWQIRTGGLILFISVVIVIICLKSIELLKKSLPEMLTTKMDDFWRDRKINRKWVTISGITLIAFAFLVAFLSQDRLGRSLKTALESTNTNGNFEGKQSHEKHNTSSKSTSGEQPSESFQVRAVSGDSVDSNAKALKNGYPSQGEIISNFPSFRGPGGIGVAFQKNIPVSWDGKSGKNIRWKTEIPLPGYNSPIVWSGHVYLSGATETRREVYCIDVETGKMLWRTSVEKLQGTPSQAPKVNKETGQAAPSMTTDGRRVYAIFANGDLIALDMDGNKVWAKNMSVPVNHYGHSSSLIMFHDLLIVQYDQRGAASVMALSGKTGEVVWKTTRNVQVSWASPVVVNTGQRTELILSADPAVISYNPTTGKELWRIDCISGEVGPSVAYAAGMVFSVNEYAKLAAVQIGETPKLLWEDNEYLSDVPSPVATENLLFLVTSYGTIVCYDTKTGTKHWVKELGNTTYSSPMLVEGKVYQMDKSGIMHIFKADKVYTSIGEPQISEGSFCTPAFADGRIFIRGNNNLYCIGK